PGNDVAAGVARRRGELDPAVDLDQRLGRGYGDRGHDLADLNGYRGEEVPVGRPDLRLARTGDHDPSGLVDPGDAGRARGPDDLRARHLVTGGELDGRAELQRIAHAQRQERSRSVDHHAGGRR